MHEHRTQISSRVATTLRFVFQEIAYEEPLPLPPIVDRLVHAALRYPRGVPAKTR